MSEPAVPEGGDFVFEDREAGARIMCMLHDLNVLGVVYIISTSILLSTSAYTYSASNLDRVVLVFDSVTADIASGFFVAAGFITTFMYTNVHATSYASITQRVLYAMVTDMLLATPLAMLVGTLDELLQHRFYAWNVLLTMVEGVTSFRVLDMHQDDRLHTYNAASWPCQCLFWCIVGLPGAVCMCTWLQTIHGGVGYYCIACMNALGVTLFSLFCTMRPDSNLFYGSATQVTYRTIEFSIGMHVCIMSSKCEFMVATVVEALHHTRNVVAFIFVCMWWSEVGVEPRDAHVCIRMYVQNKCMAPHSAFYVKGCFIGILIIAKGMHAAPSRLEPTHVLLTSGVLLTASVFCWPVFMAIRTVLLITFDDSAVNGSAALISVIKPCILYAIVIFYKATLRPRITCQVQHKIQDVHIFLQATYMRLRAGSVRDRVDSATRELTEPIVEPARGKEDA